MVVGHIAHLEGIELALDADLFGAGAQDGRLDGQDGGQGHPALLLALLQKPPR